MIDVANIRIQLGHEDPLIVPLENFPGRLPRLQGIGASAHKHQDIDLGPADPRCRNLLTLLLVDLLSPIE